MLADGCKLISIYKFNIVILAYRSRLSDAKVAFTPEFGTETLFGAVSPAVRREGKG